jgi:hypothetical protein
MTANYSDLVDSTSPADESAIRRLLRELSPEDWLVFVYLLVLNFAAFHAAPGRARTLCLEQTLALFTVVMSVVALVRGRFLRGRFAGPLLYRLAMWGTVQLSYFMFATFLPVINPTSLDLELYHLDLRIFGFEPALYMDRFVSPVATEWFAFFYFSYFMILAAHLFPILFFGKDRKLVAEFSLGFLLMFCIGHTGYMLVPGFGPHHAIAQEFHHELPTGMWLDAVMTTVSSGGAQKDIFPSLHTAAPTFLALFSMRHRDKLPFRYTWPIVTFFAVNIILATMYLRWHYIIDVIAGMFLATGSLLGSVALQRREFARRHSLGLRSSWPVFFSDDPNAGDRTVPEVRRAA